MVSGMYDQGMIDSGKVVLVPFFLIDISPEMVGLAKGDLERAVLDMVDLE